MLEELANAKSKVIGVKQVTRAIALQEVKQVFIAADADAHIREQVIKAANEKGIPYQVAPTKKQLGVISGISVDAACAAIK